MRDMWRVMGRGVPALVIAGAVFAAAPVSAQIDEFDPGPRLFVGIQGQYARPVGEFHDYVQHGGGLNVNLAVPLTRNNPLAFRIDGGFLIYGSETRRVCFSTTVGCRILLDLKTTNNIAYVNIGPQLMLPGGAVRPYVNAAIGGSYFATTSSVEGTDGNDEEFASTTNFSDLTFAWNAGSGLLVQVSRGQTPVWIDLGARYHGNGEVEYLKKGDITDNPDGSITLSPTRSLTNLVTIQLGVTIGARTGN